MERNEAARILRQLGDGLDPATGRQIEGEDALTVLNRADTLRALHVAVAALEQQQRRTRASSAPNRGKPWSEDEDRKLLSAFDTGGNVEEIAQTHQRTKQGIRARLQKYGRLVAALAALALGAIVAPQEAHAEPYAAAGLVDTDPELAAGYRWRHVELEAGAFRGWHYGTVHHISSSEEWTIDGERLTLRGAAPVNEWLTLTAGVSAYRLKYDYTNTAGQSATARGNSHGWSLGAAFAIGQHGALRVEYVTIDGAKEAEALRTALFPLPRIEQTRIAAEWRF
jgi:hypothetical protein